MAEKVKVGIAQIDVGLTRQKDNVSKHMDYLAQAKARGIEVLVFPETSLSGFPHHSPHEYALRTIDDVIRKIAEQAGDITTVLGIIEEAPAAQFYNTTLVCRQGKLLHIHRKLNLATYGSLEEGKYFAQGRYVDTFDLHDPAWRAAVLICADAWNPALVHLAALHGATMLIVPTNSAEDAVSSDFSNRHGWDLTTRFYSMIYGMPLVMANRVGVEADLTFWGGSRIVDPFGQVVAQADEASEQLIDATLDYADVRRARVQLPTVRDSNLALLHREIGRLESLIGVPPSVRGG